MGRRLIWSAVGLSIGGTILVEVPFLLHLAGTSEWQRLSVLSLGFGIVVASAIMQAPNNIRALQFIAFSPYRKLGAKMLLRSDYVLNRSQNYSRSREGVVFLDNLLLLVATDISKGYVGTPEDMGPYESYRIINDDRAPEANDSSRYPRAT